jgi:hypothetical protein
MLNERFGEPRGLKRAEESRASFEEETTGKKQDHGAGYIEANWKLESQMFG